MTKCKYYTECVIHGDGCAPTYGCCYGQKYAPRVYCNGDESKCECKNNTDSNYYDLVSETVFQVKITEKDNTVEKVYCKSREDAKSFINTVLEKRDLTRIKSIQITPIKNLYYRKR